MIGWRNAHPSTAPRSLCSVPLCALAMLSCERDAADPQRQTPAPTGSVAQNTEPAPWFRDITADCGVNFRHESGHSGKFYTPEIMCGGVALLDVESDGDLDIYLVQSGGINTPSADRSANQLFLNDGLARFTPAPNPGDAADRGYGIGAAAGDYDNDGDVDLYVTNLGPNVLLRNNGAGAFDDVTATAGVGGDGFSTSAAFFDYDADGDLDLFVLDYLLWSPQTELDCYGSGGQLDYCSPDAYRSPAPNILYRNDGNGAFTDVSEHAGIAFTLGTSLGVVCSDFNGDRWLDVFVANDRMPNHLWINSGDGTFRELAVQFGCAMDLDGIAKAGMGIAVGDINRDGRIDLAVANLRRERDSLFLNEGQSFRDATLAWGLGQISRNFTRFGMGWIDFDNDGSLDLYQANGRVANEPDAVLRSNIYAEPNILYRGTAENRFQEVVPRGGTTPVLAAASRAAAFGDLNNDGRVDIVVANRDDPPNVLLNQVAPSGNWLLLRVLDEHGRDALNARVVVHTPNSPLHGEVRSAYSYCSSNDPRLHFGLGSAPEVSSLLVTWIDGTVERFDPPPVNSIAIIRRGTGTAIP